MTKKVSFVIIIIIGPRGKLLFTFVCIRCQNVPRHNSINVGLHFYVDLVRAFLFGEKVYNSKCINVSTHSTAKTINSRQWFISTWIKLFELLSYFPCNGKYSKQIISYFNVLISNMHSVRINNSLLFDDSFYLCLLIQRLLLSFFLLLNVIESKHYSFICCNNSKQTHKKEVAEINHKNLAMVCFYASWICNEWIPLFKGKDFIWIWNQCVWRS